MSFRRARLMRSRGLRKFTAHRLAGGKLTLNIRQVFQLARRYIQLILQIVLLNPHRFKMFVVGLLQTLSAYALIRKCQPERLLVLPGLQQRMQRRGKVRLKTIQPIELLTPFCRGDFDLIE